ncbi:MAG: hypothetical protein MUD14_02570 [Hydrococcus sp. Prado102]|jgi:predicted RNase H-like nuclease (RuvC/YqgF family)|nr:hypothetical protein [Hydrococcus sp. Prado102]
MKKRNLSDLLREEIQHTEDSSTPSVEPQKQADEGQTASSKGKEVKSSSTRSRRGAPTNQSEDKIKELTSALESAQQRAKSLESQVASLESELQTQKNLVETFESQLQQKTEIETELEEQKQLVHKLYSELGKIDTVLTELEEQKQLVERLSTELEETRSALPLSTEESPAKSVSLSKIPSKQIARFIAVNQSPTILSNEDIGWFD